MMLKPAQFVWRNVEVLRTVAATLWHRINARFKTAPALAKAAAGRRKPVRFRKVLLDQLDFYIKAVRRMKGVDPEAYNLYAKIGGHISLLDEDDDVLAANFLSPWWLQTMPSFGCIAHANAFEARARKDWLYPRFTYFRKYRKELAPSIVQRIAGKGEVYVVTVFWCHDDGDKRLNVPIEFPVFVSHDGTVTVLKTKMVINHRVRSKYGPNRGEVYSIPQVAWTHDEFLRTWAAEHKQSADNYLRWVFCLAASEFEAANMKSMVRIAATRGDVTAVFGIDLRRSAYFFKDRETITGIDGNRKRVFHIVKAHGRKRGNRWSDVRIHFRGERQFTWNGYSVLITVPGLHHADLAEFDAAGADLDSIVGPQDGWWDDSKVAEVFSDHLKTTHRTLKDVRSKPR